MDTNGDGITTNAEVEANWMNTPSAVFNTKAPFIHPDGQWTGEDLVKLQDVQEGFYQQAKTIAMAMDDADLPPFGLPRFGASHLISSAT